MSAWSHLPNAAHIDRIIESLGTHPEVWNASRNAARNATRNAAWNAAYDAAYDAARNAARNATYDATRSAIWVVTRNNFRMLFAAGYAILALIAYDDAVKYLNMSSDQLKMWAILSEEPAAVLLLPAVVAYEKISKLETV